jgi:trimeric autotransporter adhesin
MKIKISSILLLIFTACIAQAQQVGINTTGANPDNSAILDINSNTKGLLVPRMTAAQRLALVTPANSLVVYDSTTSHFYYYTGSTWLPVCTGTSGWSINGNSGTVSGNHFLGTTDNQAFNIKTNNTLHTRFGINGHIEILNTGMSTYLGENAGIADDLNNRRNVGIGVNALLKTTTAAYNTAVGYLAMQNATASSNTAVGYQAMPSNTTGVWNTVLGQNASLNVSTGSYNTGLGGQTLGSASGSHNVAIGMNTMVSNSTGQNNVAIGASALNNNTTGNNNMAIGYLAGTSNVSLNNITAIGSNASATQSNTLIMGPATAVGVGIGTSAPLSKLDVIGSMGMTVKSNQVAGTNHPDNTASIWIYASGAGTITLPAASTCTNRVYEIVNATGATTGISSYEDLTGNLQTSMSTGTSIAIASDGTNWVQIW